MNKSTISQFFGLILILICFFSCENNQEKNFIVEGKITGANEKILYLERTANHILDSIQLNEAGDFKFSAQAQDRSDFYRLRLGKQLIHFVVDSTENVVINADAAHFAKDYDISGSVENQKIKELSRLQANTQAEYQRLVKQVNNQDINTMEYFEKATAIINDYKSKAQQYIHDDYASPSAYFALFQQIDNMLIFDPYDKDDSKLFGALANVYPDSIRREQVKSFYLKGLAYLRNDRSSVNINEVSSKELFDLSLPGTDGKNVVLSEVGEGKLTLIDFTVYNDQASPYRNILLAELYNKYHGKNFEIYQISLDPDEHLWKNAAYNLPWITVWDIQSIYSANVSRFNVTSIPTSFLRNGKGEIIMRVDNPEELEHEIKKHLKK